MNLSQLEANQVAGAKRGKTRAGKSRLVLVLLLIGRERSARFFSQSRAVAMQNQSNSVITYDTQLKTALYQPEHGLFSDILVGLRDSTLNLFEYGHQRAKNLCPHYTFIEVSVTVLNLCAYFTNLTQN